MHTHPSANYQDIFGILVGNHRRDTYPTAEKTPQQRHYYYGAVNWQEVESRKTLGQKWFQEERIYSWRRKKKLFRDCLIARNKASLLQAPRFIYGVLPT